MVAHIQDRREAVRQIMIAAGCQTHLEEMMELAEKVGRLPDIEKEVKEKAREHAKARSALIKHLESAVHAAKYVARLERPTVKRGLAVFPPDPHVRGLEMMLATLQSEATAYARGGRPRTLGPSHFALAIWGVLDRAEVPQRQRASVTRDCLSTFGVEPERVDSAIKYARAYFKQKKPPVE